MRIIHFSAYGPYLREPRDKLIDFNERGVSIVSPDGKELWHKDVEQFKLAKEAVQSCYFIASTSLTLKRTEESLR